MADKPIFSKTWVNQSPLILTQHYDLVFNIQFSQ